MIEGRDDQATPLLAQTGGDRLAAFPLAVIEHDLGAIAGGEAAFDLGGVGGHDDGGGQAEACRGGRHRLGVIARGVGDHPRGQAVPFGRGEQGVQRAADLEAPGPLQGLGLEQDLRPRRLVKEWIAEERRAMDAAGKPPRRRFDVGKIGLTPHARSPFGSPRS